MKTQSFSHKLNKKLAFHKETIRELTATDLANAAAGIERTVGGFSCLIRCASEKECPPSAWVTAPICLSQDEKSPWCWEG